MSHHSRQQILDRLRSRTLKPAPLPNIDAQQMIRYDDLPQQFCESAELVGASVHRCESIAEVQAVLRAQESYREGRTIASTVTGIDANFDASTIASPRELASLDWMIVRGRFAVAENGSIWIPADEVHDRTQIFITQHLAIVLDADEIVPHMHAAYERLGPISGYGVFVSGPSKTADIEQSLVLGAHGCRTLTIFLITAAGR